jgi:ribosomal protein S18 acetylase RimI-like enzyme
MLRPTKNNEALAHSAQLTTSFIAPWERGHGLARMIAVAVEDRARELGVRVLNLDVRETQEAAITLYRSLGYHEVGRHPHYARVANEYVGGLYFWKDLQADNGASA